MHAGVEMSLQRRAVLSLLVIAVSFRAVTTLSTAPSNAFVEVRPKLWRYNREFAFLPSPAARTPVAVWLVEVKSSLILIDTGAASPEYRVPFLEALKSHLNSLEAPLRTVLCWFTHALLRLAQAKQLQLYIFCISCFTVASLASIKRCAQAK